MMYRSWIQIVFVCFRMYIFAFVLLSLLVLMLCYIIHLASIKWTDRLINRFQCNLYLPAAKHASESTLWKTNRIYSHRHLRHRQEHHSYGWRLSNNSFAKFWIYMSCKTRYNIRSAKLFSLITRIVYAEIDGKRIK